MKKKKKDKFKVSWLRRLNTKLDMLDAQMGFKLYPAILAACSFALIILIALLCMLIYG